MSEQKGNDELTAAYLAGCYDTRKAYEQRLAAAESRTCELQENSDTDSGAWLGECGATWTFIDNDPKQNSCVYCPQCGGKLVVSECPVKEGSGN